MSEDLVRLTVEAGIATITLDAPSRLNAIDAPMAERLVQALAVIERDPTVGAVLLRGSGRAFMAGGDLRSFQAAGERAPEAVSLLIEPFHDVIRGIRALPVPVVAAVHGAVAGGGVAVALACDFVIAAADAVFTPAYLRIATNPDGGTTWSVVRLLGERRALEWLMLGEPMEAARAVALGLINRAVGIDDLEAEAGALARRLADGPADAQASLKRLIWRASSSTLDNQMEAEATGFLSLSATADFREGVSAFFEQRTPRFAAPGPSGDEGDGNPSPRGSST